MTDRQPAPAGRDGDPGGALARRVRALGQRPWSFREGLMAGSVATAGIVLATWALASGPGGDEPVVPTGLAGPVAGATAAPQVVEPAPAVTTAPTVEVPASGSGSGSSSGGEDGGDEDGSGDEGGEQQVDEPVSVPVANVARAGELPSARSVSCPTASRTVASAAELERALATARPGDVIELADGAYTGTFTATTSGTAARPIWLCGGRGAVLQTGTTRKGYGFHLAGAQHWRLVGFTVRNSQKGVVADGTSGTVIQGLLVEEIGDEAIHLRSHSTGNAVLENTVRSTGLRKEKFGEGVYVGSAESNWEKYGGGGPDRSDFNLVARNTISRTTAESVDIKEGTTGGALLDNTFDGTGMTEADSWVDVKGNEWLVRGNTGRNTPKDGMQTHRILDGWGERNVFDANVLDVPGTGEGVGVYVHKPDDTANRVLCTNRDSAGGPVTSTIPCSG